MSLEIEVVKLNNANKKEPFVGTKTAKTDDKRRLYLPSYLRKKLEKRKKIMTRTKFGLWGVLQDEGGIRYISIYDHYPIGYKPNEIEEIKLYGQNQNRILFPDKLPEFKNQEVCFVGRLKYFDVFLSKDWQG